MDIIVQVGVYALCLVAGCLLGSLLGDVDWGRALPQLGREERALGEALSEMQVTWPTGRLLARLKYVGAPVAALVMVVVTGKPAFAALAAATLWFVPGWFVKRLQRQRRQRLEEQVSDVISAFAAGAKSGMSWVQVIDEVAASVARPVSAEFAVASEAIKAGQTPQRALKDLMCRIDLPAYSLVVGAVLLNEERGGRITDVLDRVGDALRSLQKAEERVRTETSGIKLSARIMVVMPVVMGGMLSLAAPDTMGLLFTTLPGNLVLVLATILDVVGFLMLRAMADIEA